MHQLFSEPQAVVLPASPRTCSRTQHAWQAPWGPSLQPGVEGPRGWSSSRREDCDGPAGGGSRPGPMTGPAQAAAPVQGRGEETAERPKAAEAQGMAGQEDRMAGQANAPGRAPRGRREHTTVWPAGRALLRDPGWATMGASHAHRVHARNTPEKPTRVPTTHTAASAFTNGPRADSSTFRKHWNEPGPRGPGCVPGS